MNQTNIYAPISVLIPCYCCHKTIWRALASICNQTLLPSELIIVEDSSCDQGKTLAVLREFEEKYSNIFDIKIEVLSKNLGAGHARNLAWSLAKHDYIALLDSDDAWHPRKLEMQYNFMKDNPEIAVCGHEKKILDVNQIPDWPLYKINHTIISKNRLLLSNPFVTPSVMIKKSISLRFDSNKRYVDDHLLWMEIAFANLKISKLNLALVAVFKPMYGSSGLSSQLWEMEKAELNNYLIVYSKGNISLCYLIFLYPYSFAKYLRRFFIVKVISFFCFFKKSWPF